MIFLVYVIVIHYIDPPKKNLTSKRALYHLGVLHCHRAHNYNTLTLLQSSHPIKCKQTHALSSLNRHVPSVNSASLQGSNKVILALILYPILLSLHLGSAIGWWYVTFKTVFRALLVELSPEETIGKYTINIC